MKILILASAKPDLRWFKQYYMRVFPAGRESADHQFKSLLQLLKSNPDVGERVDGVPFVREFPIRKTPFTVLYRVQSEHIEILRVFDQRSEFANAN
ncbi:type II toxin-antitoxin system RelE/ParE family toxin [Halocynthiibacter namhaensis]|uniref:type II toxin-antitoxin system RelE/ParE family toxin n=1 Tax=Halocynthiibacter namhaensis TaxID=1290553 RepID=UPI0005798C65|nr:type II toxin-antitoxin system RelE/ParE family toxin [Halocynthiibacter namhaensis]